MMNERPNFVAAIRDADRAVAAMPPPMHLHEAVHRRLRRAPNIGLYLLPTVSGLALIAALLMFNRVPTPPAPVVVLAPTPQLEAEIQFEPTTCAPRTAAPDLQLAVGCSVTVDDPPVRLRALTSATLARVEHGFVVRAGRVGFEPEPTFEPTPFTVLVSAGRIDAVGERFVVEQNVTGGAVRVETGRLMFVDDRDRRTAVDNTSTFSWGDVEPTAPEMWSADRIDREVRRATQLRLTGRHREAVDHLSRLLRSPVGEGAAAVLSFERATLLETKLEDAGAACAQYRAHRARFGRDRYDRAVDAALERCREGNFDGGRE